jgi:hypothetical protein
MKTRGAYCEAAECPHRVDSAEGYVYARFRAPDGRLMPAEAPEWERAKAASAPKPERGAAWTGATS